MAGLTPQAFNQLEVILWAVAALIFLIRGWSDATCRRQSLVAVVAFLLFSGSDAVEIQTGAWWRPWWLLVWKAACVLTLAGVWWTWPRADRLTDSDDSHSDEGTG